MAGLSARDVVDLPAANYVEGEETRGSPLKPTGRTNPPSQGRPVGLTVSDPQRTTTGMAHLRPLNMWDEITGRARTLMPAQVT